MTSNAYGRLSVGNSMGGANQGPATGYSGVYGGGHTGHSGLNHGTHNSHNTNHANGQATHNTNNEVTFPNNVAPEDYLGKYFFT